MANNDTSLELPRSVLDHLLEGCQVISPDYRYLYVNDAVATQGRTARDALLGRTMMEVFPGIEHTEMFATLRRCMQERTAAQLENQFTFPDGSQGWFELRLEPVPEGVVILSMEITERKRTDARLRETQRLAVIGTTASMFAHEVGNPLNSLQLQAQLLERQLKKTPVGDGATETLGRMRTELSRLGRLLEEFRHRNSRLHMAPVNVGQCLQDLIHLHLQPLARAELRLVDDIPGDLPLVHGNADKLIQVFVNLCKNAIEAMPHGGTLTIRATTIDAGVLVEVKDTGHGISQDVDAFELFRTTKDKGMGLGLAIVRQIVEAHRGTIRYESQPGAGTTFSVTLPAS